MTDPHRPFVPPVPRDHDDASFSEMVPFQSKKISLLKSPFFILLLLTGLVGTYMFTIIGGAAQGTPQARFETAVWFSKITIFTLVMVVLLLAYLYVRPGRSFFAYLFGFAAVVAIFFTPLLQLFFYVFRSVLPGDVASVGQSPTFVQMFVAMLFGAGLMEELLKAVPILICAALAFHGLSRPAFAQNKVYQWLHLRGPLDGALMGMFAGGGFIFFETGFDYVPRYINMAFQQTQDLGTALSYGLLLMIPRVVGGIIGHMAYSGIFGYFIGLAVIRRKQMWKLLLIGYLASSLVHTLWNSVAIINPMLQYAIAIVAAIGLGAVILKARQLEAAAGVAAADTGGSIIVERPRGAAMPMAPAMAPQAPPAMVPQAPPPMAPQAPPMAAPPPAPPMAAPPPQSAPSATSAPAEVLMLNIDGMMLPLRAGGRLDLAAEPALGGRGAGILGSIIAHPTRANVLGLKNEGAAGWQAKLRDGSTQTIEREQSIRLAAGVEITFAAGLSGAVVKIG